MKSHKQHLLGHLGFDCIKLLVLPRNISEFSLALAKVQAISIYQIKSHKAQRPSSTD